jgi:hypothetical protein
MEKNRDAFVEGSKANENPLPINEYVSMASIVSFGNMFSIA